MLRKSFFRNIKKNNIAKDQKSFAIFFIEANQMFLPEVFSSIYILPAITSIITSSIVTVIGTVILSRRSKMIDHHTNLAKIAEKSWLDRVSELENEVSSRAHALISNEMKNIKYSEERLKSLVLQNENYVNENYRLSASIKNTISSKINEYANELQKQYREFHSKVSKQTSKKIRDIELDKKTYSLSGEEIIDMNMFLHTTESDYAILVSPNNLYTIQIDIGAYSDTERQNISITSRRNFENVSEIKQLISGMINKDFKSILSKVKENRKFLLTIQLVERKSKENLEIKLSEEEILNKYHEDIKKVIEEHKNLCLDNDNEISNLILKAEQGLKDKESFKNDEVLSDFSKLDKALAKNFILKAEQGLKDKESSDNNQISALISNVEKTLSRIDVKNL
jgi:hypothetical protein